MTRPPAVNPCGSCPYRVDVPSGLWAEEEYAKLKAYDGETWGQPLGLFMCHQQDGRLCAGWVGCHDMEEAAAIRVAARGLDDETLAAIYDYETTTPLFASGAEAAEHGRANIEAPDQRARKQIEVLVRKRQSREVA